MARFGGTYPGTRGTVNTTTDQGQANTLTFQLGADHTLDSVEVDLDDNGANDDYRIGVYYGPATNATLVWESGQLNGAGLDGIVEITAGGETLPAGQDIHLVVCRQSVSAYRHPSDNSENGDWVNPIQRFNDVGAVGVAFPASNTNITAASIQPLRMWINATSTAVPGSQLLMVGHNYYG